MKIKKLGNLFELANKQLFAEYKAGKRDEYGMLEILDYAIVLRKQLDKYGKLGSINKVKNLKTGKMIIIESNKDKRKIKYQQTGK
jgi:hypothetical protein